jgi:hypothetical protein
MLYYGTDPVKVQAFEKQLGERFQLELLGNGHWYLGSRIHQLRSFDIKLDQNCYCKAIVKKYLDTAGCAKNIRQHDTPLPSGFIPTSDDCPSTERESQELSTAFNIDFASCIGSLIYLSMTQADIIYAVNKMAKLTRKPDKCTSRHLFIYYNIYVTIHCVECDYIARSLNHPSTVCS